MKNLLVIALSLALITTNPKARAASFDEAFQTLTKETAVAIEQAQRKKVAVLDFTDVQGKPSPFGKFLAEQMSVGLVIEKRPITIVDRANLRKILEEHKLTESKLIEPGSASKLGEFSGVDALVIGTITSVNSGHYVTVKIISTDKSEVVGAVKGTLPLNPDFDKILASVSGEDGSGKRAAEQDPTVFVTPWIRAKFKKFQVLNTGDIIVHLDFYKRPETHIVLAGVDKQTVAADSHLISSTGDQYSLVEVNGLHIFQGQDTGRKLDLIQATAVQLRFRGASGRKVIPGTTTFALDLAVWVWYLRNQDAGIFAASDNGKTNVHFENLR